MSKPHLKPYYYLVNSPQPLTDTDSAGGKSSWRSYASDLFQPLGALPSYFIDFVRPYAANAAAQTHTAREDFFQWRSGLMDIFIGVGNLLLLPFAFFKALLSNPLTAVALALSWAIHSCLLIVKGLFKIATTPLTWFVKMPIRGLVGYFSAEKNHSPIPEEPSEKETDVGPFYERPEEKTDLSNLSSLNNFVSLSSYDPPVADEVPQLAQTPPSKNSLSSKAVTDYGLLDDTQQNDPPSFYPNNFIPLTDYNLPVAKQVPQQPTSIPTPIPQPIKVSQPVAVDETLSVLKKTFQAFQRGMGTGNDGIEYLRLYYVKNSRFTGRGWYGLDGIDMKPEGMFLNEMEDHAVKNLSYRSQLVNVPIHEAFALTQQDENLLHIARQLSVIVAFIDTGRNKFGQHFSKIEKLIQQQCTHFVEILNNYAGQKAADKVRDEVVEKLSQLSAICMVLKTSYLSFDVNTSKKLLPLIKIAIASVASEKSNLAISDALLLDVLMLSPTYSSEERAHLINTFKFVTYQEPEKKHGRFDRKVRGRGGRKYPVRRFLPSFFNYFPESARTLLVNKLFALVNEKAIIRKNYPYFGYNTNPLWALLFLVQAALPKDFAERSWNALWSENSATNPGGFANFEELVDLSAKVLVKLVKQEKTCEILGHNSALQHYLEALHMRRYPLDELSASKTSFPMGTGSNTVYASIAFAAEADPFIKSSLQLFLDTDLSFRDTSTFVDVTKFRTYTEHRTLHQLRLLAGCRRVADTYSSDAAFVESIQALLANSNIGYLVKHDCLSIFNQYASMLYQNDQECKQALENAQKAVEGLIIALEDYQENDSEALLKSLKAYSEKSAVAVEFESLCSAETSLRIADSHRKKIEIYEKVIAACEKDSKLLGSNDINVMAQWLKGRKQALNNGLVGAAKIRIMQFTQTVGNITTGVEQSPMQTSTTTTSTTFGL